MTYAEKLKSPKWQKKRLSVFERDQFTCQLCGDTENTLHVHHKHYKANPWDSPIEDLITYCLHCHAVVEVFKERSFEIRPVKIFKYELKTILMLYAISVSKDGLRAGLTTYEFIKESLEINLMAVIRPEMLDRITEAAKEYTTGLNSVQPDQQPANVGE